MVDTQVLDSEQLEIKIKKKQNMQEKLAMAPLCWQRQKQKRMKFAAQGNVH